MLPLEKVEGEVQQLIYDCAFLREHNLMDYSLLLGVIETSTRGKEYVYGIIDILQEWNYIKIIEQWVKRIWNRDCKNYKYLSAVEPEFYAYRFVSEVIGHFNVDEHFLEQKFDEAGSEDSWENGTIFLKPKKRKERENFLPFMWKFDELEKKSEKTKKRRIGN